MTEPILIWPFDKAPEKYRKLSTNGGDEDWVVFVPSVYEKEFWWTWLEKTDSLDEPDQFPVEGGTVYIGCHA